MCTNTATVTAARHLLNQLGLDVDDLRWVSGCPSTRHALIAPESVGVNEAVTASGNDTLLLRARRHSRPC